MKKELRAVREHSRSEIAILSHQRYIKFPVKCMKVLFGEHIANVAGDIIC